jgi:periplasmic divalent cation tolerance protein
MAETEFVVIMTTAGSEEQATNLAQELVERRLAACVNIVAQVCSVYRWKGKVWQDEEKLLIIKTAAHLFPAVRDAIRELHTYELPECIMLPVQKADPEILEWLESCLAPDTASRPDIKAVDDPDGR